MAYLEVQGYLGLGSLRHELGGRHFPPLLRLLVEVQQLPVEQKGVPRLDHAPPPVNVTINRHARQSRYKSGEGRKTPLRIKDTESLAR